MKIERFGSGGVCVAVCLVALLSVGCGSEAGTGASSGAGSGTTPTKDTVTPSSDPSPSSEPDLWIAVIAAGDPEDLDDETQALRDTLGPALIVSPVSCFEGLPDQARDGYILGAVGQTREAAETAALNADRSPLFVVAVTTACTD